MIGIGARFFLFCFRGKGNRALAMWSANAAFGRVVEGSQLQGRTFRVTEPDGSVRGEALLDDGWRRRIDAGEIHFHEDLLPRD